MPHFLLLLKKNGTLPTADDLRRMGFAVSTAVCASPDALHDQLDPTDSTQHMPASQPDSPSSPLNDTPK